MFILSLERVKEISWMEEFYSMELSKNFEEDLKTRKQYLLFCICTQELLNPLFLLSQGFKLT